MLHHQNTEFSKYLGFSSLQKHEGNQSEKRIKVFTKIANSFLQTAVFKGAYSRGMIYFAKTVFLGGSLFEGANSRLMAYISRSIFG